MNFIEIAVRLDSEDNPLAAAWAYECAVSTMPHEYLWLLDAAVLYFMCADPGFAAVHRLPSDFISAAGRRCMSCLDAAEATTGPKQEIEFWRRYYEFVHLGANEIDDIARVLQKTSVSALVYLATAGGNINPASRNEIITRLPSGNGARTRYLRSLLGD